jgi:hypothetical protein
MPEMSSRQRLHRHILCASADKDRAIAFRLAKQILSPRQSCNIAAIILKRRFQPQLTSIRRVRQSGLSKDLMSILYNMTVRDAVASRTRLSSNAASPDQLDIARAGLSPSAPENARGILRSLPY